MYISYVDKNHIDAYMGTKFVNRTQKMIFGNGTLFTPLSKEDTYVSKTLLLANFRITDPVS